MQVGDGTTSVTVLAGQLLGEAEALLMQKLHPQTIIAGLPRGIRCVLWVLAGHDLHGDARLVTQQPPCNSRHATAAMQQPPRTSRRATTTVQRQQSSGWGCAVQAGG